MKSSEVKSKTLEEELNAKIDDSYNTLKMLSDWLGKHKLYTDEIGRYSEYLDEFFDDSLGLTEGEKADELGLFIEDHEDLMDRFEEAYGVQDTLDELFFEVEDKISTVKAEQLIEPLNESYELLMQDARASLSIAYELIASLIENTD